MKNIPLTLQVVVLLLANVALWHLLYHYYLVVTNQDEFIPLLGLEIWFEYEALVPCKVTLATN